MFAHARGFSVCIVYVTYSVGLTRVAVSLDPGQESTAGPGATLAWAWGSCARGWKRPPCRSRWPLAGGAGTTRALAGQEQANNAAKPIPHLPLLGALLFYYRKLCLIVTSTGKKKKRSSVHSTHCILLCKYISFADLNSLCKIQKKKKIKRNRC